MGPDRGRSISSIRIRLGRVAATHRHHQCRSLFGLRVDFRTFCDEEACNVEMSFRHCVHERCFVLNWLVDVRALGEQQLDHCDRGRLSLTD